MKIPLDLKASLPPPPTFLQNYPVLQPSKESVNKLANIRL